MKFCRRILPNLSIAFSIALIVVGIFNNRNPVMGFLLSTPGLILLILTCVLSIASNAIAYYYARKKKKRRQIKDFEP